MPTNANIPISEVDRIAALTDPVLRNLQITQCYHELALVLAERTSQSANWCTFATWASKQAGQTIRKEDLGRTLEAILGSEAAAVKAAQDLQAAAQRLGAQLGVEEILELIWKAYDPQAAFDRSSAAVARGNLKVFAEIGREFARFTRIAYPIKFSMLGKSPVFSSSCIPVTLQTVSVFCDRLSCIIIRRSLQKMKRHA